ncbi:hypothetical protein T4D_2267, partial [Trichinella pseudospiralis]
MSIKTVGQSLKINKSKSFKKDADADDTKQTGSQTFCILLLISNKATCHALHTNAKHETNINWRRPLVRIPLLGDLPVCALLQSVQINVQCNNIRHKLTAVKVQRMEHGKPENVFNTKQSPDSTEQNKKTKK